MPNGSTAPPNAMPNTRIIAANAAAFTPAAMNAVTGVGAPSYASGAHMWNGTAATLKPNATRRKYSPTKNSRRLRRRASALRGDAA